MLRLPGLDHAKSSVLQSLAHPPQNGPMEEPLKTPSLGNVESRAWPLVGLWRLGAAMRWKSTALRQQLSTFGTGRCSVARV